MAIGTNLQMIADKSLQHARDNKEKHRVDKSALYSELTTKSSISVIEIDTEKSTRRNAISPTVSDSNVAAKHCPEVDFSNEECTLTNSHDSQDEIQQGSMVPNGDTEAPVNTAMSEDETIYNYHSITRDPSGKLRLVNNNKPKSQSPVSNCSDINSPPCSPQVSPKENDTTRTVSQDFSFRNTHSARNLHTDITDLLHDPLTLDYNTYMGDGSYITNNCLTNLDDEINERHLASCDRDTLLQKVNYSTVSRAEDLDLSDQKLEEYFSELRQCLQLTNSQETVYKLACDAQDHELMELLELVLKKKPPVLNESLNFIANPLAIIRHSLAEPDHGEQESLNEASQSPTRNQKQIIKQATSSAAEKDEPHSQHHNPKKKTVSDSETCSTAERITLSQCFSQTLDRAECSQSTAKALISLFGHILSSRRSLQEQRSTTESPVSIIDKIQSLDFQRSVEKKCSGDTKSAASSSTHPTEDTHRQPQYSENSPAKLIAQKFLRKHNRNNAEQCKDNNMLDVLTEGSEENYELTNSVSDVSSVKATPTAPSKGCNSGAESYAGAELPNTKIISREHPEAGPVKDLRTCQKTRAPLSPEKTTKLCPVLERDETYTAQGMEPCLRPLSLEKEGTCSDGDNVRGAAAKESRPHRDSLAPADRKYPAPIVELFRDQDEYLKKLKEVREKFEMSIQALSNERKNRLAEEERQQNK
ncbi:unnamed protein product [Candidula unifasciata]|uniref:Uncharacterized protein n=1 Tax=Candidula unifasciata TaxID=100452 RepID=A0A8S3ZCU1_9EUPU|nr:unnamed protein product [Candidula unifasciata]